LTSGHLKKPNHLAKTEAGYQANLVEEIISHENYQNKVVYADIALLRTRVKWRFTDFVRPACFPNTNFDLDDQAVCVIAGWGSTDGNRQVLNQSTVPKMNWET